MDNFWQPIEYGGWTEESDEQQRLDRAKTFMSTNFRFGAALSGLADHPLVASAAEKDAAVAGFPIDPTGWDLIAIHVMADGTRIIQTSARPTPPRPPEFTPAQPAHPFTMHTSLQDVE